MRTPHQYLVDNGVKSMKDSFPAVTIERMLQEYALEAIKEDRINVAEVARAWVATNGEWTSVKVGAIVEKESIINAPYPELK